MKNEWNKELWHCNKCGGFYETPARETLFQTPYNPCPVCRSEDTDQAWYCECCGEPTEWNETLAGICRGCFDKAKEQPMDMLKVLEQHARERHSNVDDLNEVLFYLGTDIVKVCIDYIFKQRKEGAEALLRYIERDEEYWAEKWEKYILKPKQEQERKEGEQDG